MPNIIEAQLKRLKIQENGDIRKEETANALSVSLLYPVPGKPIISTVKQLRLSDDQAIDYENGTQPGTGIPYTWSQRLVLKEAVFNSTELVVQLTEIEKVSKLEKFFKGLFKSVFKALWTLASGGVGNVVLGAVVDTVGAAHLDSFDSDGVTINVIGRAEKLLTENDLPAVGESIDVTLPLIVPKEISTTIAYFNENHKVERTEKSVLAKGAHNGELVLTLTNLSAA